MDAVGKEDLWMCVFVPGDPSAGHPDEPTFEIVVFSPMVQTWKSAVSIGEIMFNSCSHGEKSPILNISE